MFKLWFIKARKKCILGKKRERKDDEDISPKRKNGEAKWEVLIQLNGCEWRK